MRKRAICFCKGDNNRLIDTNSREYIDFSGGGDNCLGYGKPLADTLSNQAAALINSPFIHDTYDQALQGIIEKDSYFTLAAIVNSPLEATSLALKAAENYFKESGIKRDKFVYGSKRHLFNDFLAIKSRLNKETAALIVEPICDNGIIAADYDFLINSYAYAKSMDILFICDETRLGLGRIGKRFAYQIYGIQPDIIILGKGLAAGLSAGALLIKNGLSYKAEDLPFVPANALTCAAINEVNGFLTNERLLQIEQTGDYLISKLVKLNKHNFVLDIRGKGLLAAIELNARVTAAKIVGQMEKCGYLVGLTEKNTLKICPPLTITRDEIDGLCAALTEIFAATNI